MQAHLLCVSDALLEKIKVAQRRSGVGPSEVIVSIV